MRNNSNYTKQWSSQNPGMLVILLDQSYSMREAYAEEGTKADFTATVFNRLIQEAINMNQDGERVPPRMKIAVIGYGGNGGDSVELMRIGFLDEYAESPLRTKRTKQKVADGDLRIVEIEVEQPVYFEAKANGSTVMGLAFQMARRIIEDFRGQYPNSPAPVLINVSDGSPWSNERKFKERDLAIAEARKIMAIPTPDGNPLIFNAHIGTGFMPCICPSKMSELKGRQAQFLFEISSEVPEVYRDTARKYDFVLDEHARGFVSNASADLFIRFINFGSSGAFARDRMSST